MQLPVSYPIPPEKASDSYFSRSIRSTRRGVGGLPLYRDISRYTRPARAVSSPAHTTTSARDTRPPSREVCPSSTRLGVTRMAGKGKNANPRGAGEAGQEGEPLLRRQLEELLGDTGTAENVRIDAVEQGSWLLVTLRAECLEEIGREVPLTKE